VIREDLNGFDARPCSNVDVIAGGLSCPPFSKAGKQLGAEDERNLFPAALRIIQQVRPRAVVIENVRRILDAIFSDYRDAFSKQMSKLGYWSDWRLLNSSDFGATGLCC
jgi:DNA (cytosine-5)-methyltransferase 1